jgi:hypothetical protein
MLRLTSVAVLAVLALGTATGDDKDNPLSEPKKSIEHQLKLLKDGDADKLKACFTKRQQDKVTKEAVATGQKAADKMTLDDLVKEVTVTEKDGAKTAKVVMKNGRTLTTLVLTDGKWLADTIWFK